MMVRTALTAALVVALAAGAYATPAKTTELEVGAGKLYLQSDDTALLAGLELFVGAGLDRESAQQNGLAALAAQTILQTPVNGMSLSDAIAARGGSLTYAIGPQYARFYLEASPASIAPLAALLGRALAAPTITPAALAAARSAVTKRITDDENNPVAVGIAMLRQSYYDGGAGLPTNGTTATLANFVDADVRSFIGAHYRRGGAIVTAVGHVTAPVAAAGRALVSALPDGTDESVVTTSRAFAPTPKRIVAQRDIGVPYVMLGFAAPSIGDKDFGPMLVLRSLFADVFDRQSATTLPAYARTVGVIYNYDTKPASLAVYINGQQVEPTAGLGSVDEVLKDVANKALTPVLLKRYKSIAHGEWQTESVSLADRAWSISNFVEQGADPDYGQTALAAIDATTSADVLRVAQTYLRKFTVALIVPRGKSQIN
ncbi:MAG: insulinase family protein [Candidatus Velthaea sp.]